MRHLLIEHEHRCVSELLLLLMINKNRNKYILMYFCSAVVLSFNTCLVKPRPRLSVLWADGRFVQWTDHVNSSGESQPSLLSSAQSHSVLSHLCLVTIRQNLKTHSRTLISLKPTQGSHTVMFRDTKGKKYKRQEIVMIVRWGRLRERRPRSQPDRRRDRALCRTGCCLVLMHAGSTAPGQPDRSRRLCLLHIQLHSACTHRRKEQQQWLWSLKVPVI